VSKGEIHTLNVSPSLTRWLLQLPDQRWQQHGLWHNFVDIGKNKDMDGFDLFFLRSDRFFPEGTLFELRSTEKLVIPDRGDGNSAELDRADVVPCPPFAENVPPSQCPVSITSFQMAGIGERKPDVEQTIHTQTIGIPVPSDAIESIVVNNRGTDFEADRYETPSIEPENTYRLYIAHLRPGFYEANVAFANMECGTLTFIKFFPPHFSDTYRQTLAAYVNETAVPERKRSDPKIPVAKRSDSASEFSDELMNKALELTTEWGENFYKPINERILRFYPDLTDDQIDRLTKLSREAESYIYALAERELNGEIGEFDIPKLAAEKYAWLSNYNASRLTNIGMFYARK